jgi:hypothetical protein
MYSSIYFPLKPIHKAYCRECYKCYCTVKPLKLSTPIIPPCPTVGRISMEPAKSYKFMRGQLSITWPPLYPVTCPCFAFCTVHFNLSILAIDTFLLYQLLHMYSGVLFTMELYCTPKVNTLQLNTASNFWNTRTRPTRTVSEHSVL